MMEQHITRPRDLVVTLMVFTQKKDLFLRYQLKLTRDIERARAFRSDIRSIVRFLKRIAAR